MALACTLSILTTLSASADSTTTTPPTTGASSISPPPAPPATPPSGTAASQSSDIPNPTAGTGTDPFIPPSTPPTPPPPVTGPTATSTVAPAAVDEEHAVTLDNADSAEQVTSGKWVLAGNVRVRYQKYVITADRADIDIDAQTALFSGHVIMTAPSGETVQGGDNGTVKINLEANSYVVANSQATVPAERFGIGLIEPLHLYNGVVNGRTDFIDAKGVNFTTCDFLDPHFHFTARDMYIIPGKKLVAKRVILYRRNRRIISWPYLVVPLDHRASTLNPQIGQSPDEGYFAKFAIGYLLSSTLPGILHIDLLQKKGIGTGIDQSYGNPNNVKHGSGELTLYQLPDKSLGRETISGSLQHRQLFGTVMANLNTQLQQDSYFLGDQNSRTLSQQIMLNRNVGNQSTSLAANINSSNYSGSTSESITSSLSESFSPTTKERFQSRFDLSDYRNSFGGTSTDTSQLNSNLEYDEQDTRYDWKILTNKYTVLNSSGGFGAAALGGLEKLPEFDLSTDPVRARLLKSILPKTSRLDFSYGAYNEPSSKTRGNRVNFGMDTGTNTFKVNSWQALDVAGDFLQRFYSDDTAQYILTSHDAYRLRIGNKSTAAVRYDYLRPYGFTPFQFDFSGVSNLISANMAYQETKTFQLNLSTGYDINAARQKLFGTPRPWQNIALQSVYTPTRYFLWRQSSSYDLNHGQLIDFTNNWSVRGRYNQALDLAARYAPQQHRISAVTEQLDLPWIVDRRESAGWRLQTIAGYNGLSNKFDYKGVAVTKSWHDWEASVIFQDNPLGFQTGGTTFTFNIRLKAFPAAQPFGVGNFGQSLGTGLGTVY